MPLCEGGVGGCGGGKLGVVGGEVEFFELDVEVVGGVLCEVLEDEEGVDGGCGGMCELVAGLLEGSEVVVELDEWFDEGGFVWEGVEEGLLDLGVDLVGVFFESVLLDEQACDAECGQEGGERAGEDELSLADGCGGWGVFVVELEGGSGGEVGHKGFEGQACGDDEGGLSGWLFVGEDVCVGVVAEDVAVELVLEAVAELLVVLDVTGEEYGGFFWYLLAEGGAGGEVDFVEEGGFGVGGVFDCLVAVGRIGDVSDGFEVAVFGDEYEEVFVVLIEDDGGLV